MDDFFLYLKLKEKFGSGLVGSCSGSFLPAVIDRRWDREREASRIDSPDSLNWQLALMSILILMRGSQISQFISCMTPPTPHPSKWTWLFYLFHLKNSFTLSFLFRPVHWEKLGVQGLPHATVIIMECLPHHKVPPLFSPPPPPIMKTCLFLSDRLEDCWLTLSHSSLTFHPIKADLFHHPPTATSSLIFFS